MFDRKSKRLDGETRVNLCFRLLLLCLLCLPATLARANYSYMVETENSAGALNVEYGLLGLDVAMPVGCSELLRRGEEYPLLRVGTEELTACERSLLAVTNEPEAPWLQTRTAWQYFLQLAWIQGRIAEALQLQTQNSRNPYELLNNAYGWSQRGREAMAVLDKSEQALAGIAIDAIQFWLQGTYNRFNPQIPAVELDLAKLRALLPPGLAEKRTGLDGEKAKAVDQAIRGMELNIWLRLRIARSQTVTQAAMSSSDLHAKWSELLQFSAELAELRQQRGIAAFYLIKALDNSFFALDKRAGIETAITAQWAGLADNAEFQANAPLRLSMQLRLIRAQAESNLRNADKLEEALAQLDAFNADDVPQFYVFSALQLHAAMLNQHGNTYQAERYFKRAQQSALTFLQQRGTQPGAEPFFPLNLLLERASNLYKHGSYAEALAIIEQFPEDQLREDDLLLFSALLIGSDEVKRASQILEAALQQGGQPEYEAHYRHNLTVALFKQGRYQATLEQLEWLSTQKESAHLRTYQLSKSLLQALSNRRQEAEAGLKALLADPDRDQALLLSNLETLYTTPNAEQLTLTRFFPVLSARFYLMRYAYHQGMVLSSETMAVRQARARLAVYSNPDNKKYGWVHAPSLALAKAQDIAVTSVAGGAVWLWQPSSGRAVRKLQLVNGEVLKLQLADDGAHLMALVKRRNHYKHFLQLWDLKHDRLIGTLGEESGEISDFDWVEREQRLLVLQQGDVELYDSVSFEKLRSFSHQSEMNGMPITDRPLLGKLTNQAGVLLVAYGKALVRWQAETGTKQVVALPRKPEQLQLSKGHDFLRVLLRKVQWDDPPSYAYFNSNTLAELQEPTTLAKAFPVSNELVADTYRIRKDKNTYVVTERDGDKVLSELRAYNRQVEQVLIRDEAQQMLLRTSEEIQLWSLETGRQLALGERLKGEYAQMAMLDKSNVLLIPGYGDQLKRLDLNTLALDTLKLGDDQKPEQILPSGEHWWLLSDNGYMGDRARFTLAQLRWQAGQLQHKPVINNMAYEKLRLLSAVENEEDERLWFYAENNDQKQLLRIDPNAEEPVEQRVILKLDYSNALYADEIVRVEPSAERLALLTERGWWQVDLATGEVQLTPEMFGDVITQLEVPDSRSQLRFVRAAARTFVTDPEKPDQKPQVLNEAITDVNYSPDGRYLLAMTADHQLLFLDPATRQPLVRLMVMEQGNWLVTDTDGRYDSNQPGNIPGASWVMPGAPLQPQPLEIFMRQFYEPGLLVRVLRGERFAPVADLHRIDTRQPLLTFGAIEKQQDGLLNVTLDLQAGEEGVASVQLFRNDQLVGRLTDVDKLGQQALRFSDIQLPTHTDVNGETTPEIDFSAYAFNREGVRSAVVRQLHAPTQQSPRMRRAYIITVGVNRYSNPAWDLTYAANDAREMQARMKAASLAASGYQLVPIQLLADEHGNNADKASLHRVFKRLAGEDLPIPEVDNWQQISRATPDDLVLFSFSGHGLLDGGEFYFFTSDIGAGNSREVTPALLQSALSGNELMAALEAVDAGWMVMIVDACQSAGALTTDGFKPGPMGSRGLGQLAWDKKMFYLSASQAEQFALESDRLNHGYLTYSLAKEGLASGQADHFPKDRQVSLREWLGYGVKRVPQLVSELRDGRFNSLLAGTRGLSSVASGQTKAAAVARLQQPVLFDFAGDRDLPLQQLAQ